MFNEVEWLQVFCSNKGTILAFKGHSVISLCRVTRSQFLTILLCILFLDIIKDLSGANENSRSPGERPCNLLSTGAILLADVIPSLCIKSISPFLPFFAK